MMLEAIEKDFMLTFECEELIPDGLNRLSRVFDLGERELMRDCG